MPKLFVTQSVEGWKWHYWFTIWFGDMRSWLAFLFRKGDNPSFCGRIERLKCRAMGHPAGEVFYNSGGLEPDDRCAQCGDYI